MLSLAGATGNRNFDAMIGQLSQFQTAARGEDLAVSINNIASSLAAANVPGERIAALGGERSLEIASTLSQVLQDPRMDKTGTAVRNLFMRMDAFTAKGETKLDDGSISRLTKEQVEGFNKLGTLDQRLAAMRATPEIGRQFMSTIEMNETKSAIRAFVLGGEAVQELEARSNALITPLDQAKQEFTDLTQVITESTPLTQAANKAEAERTVATLRDPQRSFEGQMFAEMDKALAEVELSGLDAPRKMLARSMVELRQGTGESVAKATIEELRMLQQNVPFGGQTSLDTGNRLAAAIDAIQKLERDRLAAERQQPPGVLRVNVQAPAARPKEAPLPAATAP
jgi:hypothetical protein